MNPRSKKGGMIEPKPGKRKEEERGKGERKAGEGLGSRNPGTALRCERMGEER